MSPNQEDRPGSLDPGADVRAKLDALSALLVKWNRAINLVSASTVGDVWNRHIADSLQLFDHCPAEAKTWLDLGSGGGFPGMVVAILAHAKKPDLRVELVDADQRKCAFLTAASQSLGLSATVTRARIEALAPRQADVVSARAVAPLDQLCAYALPQLSPRGVCLFLKGAAIEAEVARARAAYRFDLTLFPSITDASGVVARIANLAHV